MSIKDKISNLRSHLASNKISAFIVPSSDPHLSEYIPDCWKLRTWLSGFTGSAGTLVITAKKAALWTDSRYFIQAEHELADTGIDLCKMGLPDTLSMESWLMKNLSKGDTVGFDGRLFPHATAKKLIADLELSGLAVDSKLDIIEKVWTNRPEPPKAKAFDHQLRYAGFSVREKIDQIRHTLSAEGANCCIVNTLDEVAWTFNIRGNDVDYNPVVLSYGFISEYEAVLFIDMSKIEKESAYRLEEQGVEIMEYHMIEKYIKSLSKHCIVALDENRTNHRLASLIPKKATIKSTLSIPTRLKSIKNAVELENIRECHILDGVAMCQFLHWFENNIGKKTYTEITTAEKLLEFRKKQPGFVSESFGPIVGYKEHGAIVHYSASPESASTIKPDGFLLIDSGGQYHQGTTDITRTIHLSTPTDQEKIDYTLVLKGMIQVSMIHFPAGTRGTQLDVLARMAMWNRGINYGHGTGHGVGAFLNVHEGPQSIRPNENPVTLEPGMLQSNEPGIYRAGKYGIRIENLIACQEAAENDFGKFYSFETITLCPIETKSVNIDILTIEERNWLNSYHKMVFEKLAPKLTAELKTWLQAKTKAI
jgi:Xaa-Pro aminopeptidase